MQQDSIKKLHAEAKKYRGSFAQICQRSGYTMQTVWRTMQGKPTSVGAEQKVIQAAIEIIEQRRKEAQTQATQREDFLAKAVAAIA